jgi:hypothetical protein
VWHVVTPVFLRRVRRLRGSLSLLLQARIAIFSSRHF